MRPMLVNTRQKVAVLASGLAIATTGFVTDADAASKARGKSTAAAAVKTDVVQPGRAPK